MDEALTGLAGDPGGVGGDEEASTGEEVGGEEGVLGRGRFGGEDVEAGPGDGVLAEGGGEGGLVDEGAAAGVEEEGGGFHEAEGFGVDEVLGLGGEGAVEGEDVGGGEEGMVIEAGDFGGVGGAFAAEGVDGHAEGSGDAGHGAADVAEAGDADGFAGEFEGGVVETGEDGGLVPEGGLGGVAVDVGGEVEEEGDGVLGDAGGGVSGDVADGDVVEFGGVKINAVDAGGSDEDEFEIGAGGEEFGGEEDFIGDDDVGILAAFDGLSGGGGGVGGEGAKGLEGGEVEVGRGEGGGVEEGDLHCGYWLLEEGVEEGGSEERGRSQVGDPGEEGLEVVGGGLADGGEEALKTFGEPGGVFLGDGGLVGEALGGGGVGEAEAPGVEHEAGGGAGLALGLGIDGIAEEGAADVFHVDTDLVGAAGVEDAENEGGVGIGIGGEGVVVGDGGAAGAGIDDGHFLAVDGMTAEVGEDGAVGLGGDALGDGEVEFGSLAFGELCGEGLLGAIGFGGDDAAGGVLVEAVDDAGALDAADAGELPGAVVEEGVDKGAVGVACGRVHDEADGFVEDNEFVVLEEDVKGDVLGEGLGGFWFGNLDGDGVALGDVLFGAGGGAVEENVAGFQEGLDARPGEVGEVGGEVDVKAFAEVVLDGDAHGMCLAGGERRIKGNGGAEGEKPRIDAKGRELLGNGECGVRNGECGVGNGGVGRGWGGGGEGVGREWGGGEGGGTADASQRRRYAEGACDRDGHATGAGIGALQGRGSG